MQTVPLPEGKVRAHAHHKSRSDKTPEPYSHGIRQKSRFPGEAVYRHGSLTATYLHMFFPSNPEAIARLFSSSKSTHFKRLSMDFSDDLVCYY
jgi:cobyrinic acid a,c-diamide synthase